MDEISTADLREQKAEKLKQQVNELQTQVSGLKCLKNTFKESEKRFRTLAETSSAAFMIYEDHKCVYANPAAEKTMGYTQEELKRITIQDLVHPVPLGDGLGEVEHPVGEGALAVVDVRDYADVSGAFDVFHRQSLP